MSEATTRRLPIYLLLDCSSSMAGPPMNAVRQGLSLLLADLRSNPQALETAHLSVITFDNDAKQVLPLTELTSVQEPTLRADGMTCMGAALCLLADAIERDCRKTSPTVKGDYRPIAFLLTDGDASDSTQAGADKLRAMQINLIACAAGPGANTAELKKITECVVKLDTLEPASLKAFFKWVSASVKTTSRNLAQAPAGGTPMPLPATPAGFTIVP